MGIELIKSPGSVFWGVPDGILEGVGVLTLLVNTRTYRASQ